MCVRASLQLPGGNAATTVLLLQTISAAASCQLRAAAGSPLLVAMVSTEVQQVKKRGGGGTEGRGGRWEELKLSAAVCGFTVKPPGAHNVMLTANNTSTQTSSHSADQRVKSQQPAALTNVRAVQKKDLLTANRRSLWAGHRQEEWIRTRQTRWSSRQ